MKKLFEGQNIDVVVEGKRILFNVDDVAYAVGYAKPASLERHIKGTKFDIIAKNGKRYTTRQGLDFAADLATKTPIMKRIAVWAKKIKYSEMGSQPATPPVKKEPQWPLPGCVAPTPGVPAEYNISAAAKALSMGVKELSDWLVDKGYAGRYTSNNSVFWKQWFRDQKYGIRPIIKDAKGERESNVAKLTQAGLDFVKNRIASERQASVLSFSHKEASEAEKLEKEVEDLIKKEFKQDRSEGVFGVMYDSISEASLIKKVKSIIAQVKLKEKKT